MNKSIPLTTEPQKFRVNDIMFALQESLSRDELFQFIKELDLNIQDYEFTKRLSDHFNSELISEDGPRPIIGEIYRHYKGNMYEIIAFCKDSETSADVIVYRRANPARERDGGDTWTRTLGSFNEHVFRPDYDYKGPRFKLFRDIDGNHVP